MSYLKDFQTHITNHDYPAFLKLWEEYCSGDDVDPQELIEILKAAKGSPFAENFGRHVDRILPLWQKLGDLAGSYEAIALILDIETTNTPRLAEIAYEQLEKKHASEKHFGEKLRLVGLRGKEKFQGAISNYELLTHAKKGNFVFHTGGWGVGEIADISLVREQLSIEFDYVPGKKDLSFETAFKSLIPIPNDHFLALRFGSPDLLEKQAKEHPAEVIRMLLRDLGPKTASEIKDELCDLVIPAQEWARWWQTARARVKKDTMIETPEELREPFKLRLTEMPHEERLQKLLETKPDASGLIHMVYSFMKDYPETLKNGPFRSQLAAKVFEFLTYPEISDAQLLQIHFFLLDLGEEKKSPAIAQIISSIKNPEHFLEGIEILSFKKRFLVELRKHRSDWKEHFLALFLIVDHNPLRDYILQELLHGKMEAEVKKKLEELCAAPGLHPETFLWYFQKAMVQNDLPCTDREGRSRFFESLLILLSHLEHDQSYREAVKKIHGLLSANRYAIVRQVMQSAKLDEVKEFLLLATKCHSLGDHDIKILHSLAEVSHPSVAKLRKKSDADTEEAPVIWTTQEGYSKLQHRIQQIATVETVENAREIEVARAHGDLRENAEFKAALEKRSRLQAEVKTLSEQLSHARVLAKEDITPDKAGVGTIVTCKTDRGETLTYTILGPWDADTERNILSFQSKLAQAMKGLSVGNSFQFQGHPYTITSIRSYL